MRKITSYEQIPLGSNFFLPGNCIGAGSLGANNIPPQNAPPPPAYPAMQSMWNNGGPPAYSPQPPSPYYQYSISQYPSPWGHGQYPHMPQMHSPMPSLFSGMPLTTTPTKATAGPSASRAADRDIINEWCNTYELGEDERQGLAKLGFKAGDKLDGLTNSVWEWAGVAPLCRLRILAAYETSQECGV